MIKKIAFCELAKQALKNLSFGAGRKIVLKTVSKIVVTQLGLKVDGNMPVSAAYFVTIEKGGIQDVKFQSVSRDCGAAQCGKINAF